MESSLFEMERMRLAEGNSGKKKKIKKVFKLPVLRKMTRHTLH